MQFAIRDNCLMLSGTVTVQTLTAPLYRSFLQMCSRPEVHTLDLGGVQQADSACISLLLSALRSRGAGSLKLVELPDAAQHLAALYEIQEWIHAWTPDTPEPLSYSHSA